MSIYTIGIDVGGTKTAYGLFDGQKKLICNKKTMTSGELPPEKFFDDIVLNIKEIMREYYIKENELRGIGIGMPSFVLYEEGKIAKTANLPLIKDFHARNYLIKKWVETSG